MMKQILLSVCFAALAIPVAGAQNTAEVSKAEAGQACIGCNLFQADLSFSKTRNVSYAGSRLRQSNMTIAIMDGVNFSNADLSIANLAGGRFTGASFKGADLTHASLVGGSFDSADFTGANLGSANLSGAEMRKSRGLTQNQLDRACGDDATELPGGLKVQHCE